MKETYIRTTFITGQTKFIENCQYCKQIDEFLDIKNCQTRPQAQKPICLGLESEKSENQLPNFEIFEKYIKFAHEISVHNGSYAFPNELVRFRIEAKPIWGKFRNTVKMQS